MKFLITAGENILLEKIKTGHLLKRLSKYAGG
jgi:hypothetical protein